MVREKNHHIIVNKTRHKSFHKKLWFFKSRHKSWRKKVFWVQTIGTKYNGRNDSVIRYRDAMVNDSYVVGIGKEG